MTFLESFLPGFDQEMADAWSLRQGEQALFGAPRGSVLHEEPWFDRTSTTWFITGVSSASISA